MDDRGFSAVPCTDLARKMVVAREMLAHSSSQEGRSTALREFEALQEAIAEMQFFSEGCAEPEDEADPLGEFHRDLYGRNGA